MAEVYKAQTRSPEGVERTLVIKKILPAYATNHHFVRMLVAEARVSSLLSHPNIVQIFELGEIDKQFYIAMEYVPGPDLLAVLQAAARAKLRVPLGLALYVISEICNGLHYAHRAKDPKGRPLNLIHRDISPSNILISDKGSVKLMDFGVASADLTRSGRERAVDPSSGTLKGKLGYMAPEQVSGLEVDHRADIFALGIVLFETLTLKRLFLGPTDAETLNNIRGARLDLKLQRHPYIPKDIQTLLYRALAKSPEDRYPNANAFREDLLNYLFDQRLRVTQRTLARVVNDLNWSKRHLTQERTQDDNKGTPSEPSKPEEAIEREFIPDLSISKEHTFALHSLDGIQKEALSYRRMQGLIERGALVADDMVSISDGPTLRLDALLKQHDFNPLLSPLAERPHCDRQGPSNRMVLIALFYELIASGKTWTLLVSAGERSKYLSVKRGQVIAADSRSEEERLGRLMLAQGVLDAEALAEAIISSAKRGLRLGDALIADGRVAPHVLLDLLQRQLKERVIELLGWNRGWFMLFEGNLSQQGAPLDGIEGTDLIMQALRSHWSLSALEHLFEGHMKRSIILNSEALERALKLPLTPHESRIEARIAPHIPLGELIADLQPDDKRTTLALLMLKITLGQAQMNTDTDTDRPS